MLICSSNCCCENQMCTPTSHCLLHSSMIPSVLILSVAITLFFADVESRGGIGVNYGMLGDNLPAPARVVSLLKSRNVDRVRLFDPNPGALAALRGSGISVVLGTLNQDLPSLAQSRSYAAGWVAANVAAHHGLVRFRYVTVGNEVVPGSLAAYVLPAMRNLDAALKAAKLRVPVTTVVSMQVLGVSHPPSRGAFSSSVEGVMVPIVGFLKFKGYPLLVNVYPYFAYAANESSIRPDYALLSSTGVAVADGRFGYTNLLHAMVDAVHSALEKAGARKVKVVVAETGWPSGGGGAATTVANAKMYNNNAVWRARSKAGTPRRPGRRVETYLFAIFNENAKPGGLEQNFGLYHPNMSEVYHVDL